MDDHTQASAWPHAPAHLFAPDTFYMTTASTLYKQPVFNTPEKLRLLQNTLFDVMRAFGWELQAWAVFNNHYHWVARSCHDVKTLKRMIQRLHSQTARLVNTIDQMPGRRVWYQYWDTCLTYEGSYYARLNYVHNNPVRHGLVSVAEQYPFCSARWFSEQAAPDFYQKVSSFPFDRVKVPDNF